MCVNVCTVTKYDDGDDISWNRVAETCSMHGKMRDTYELMRYHVKT